MTEGEVWATGRPLRLHQMWVPGADEQRDHLVAQLAATPDVEVCHHIDSARRGIAWNYMTAVACILRETAEQRDRGEAVQPWHFIVQDDAEPSVPAPEWVDHLRSACDNAPTRVLGLTYFGQYGVRSVEKGAAYVVGKSLIWGCAVAYRDDFMQEFGPWAIPVMQRTGYPHDDRMVGAFALRNGEDTGLTARAIFDQPVKRSLVGHNTPIRRPALTLRDEGPPWSSTVPPTRRSSSSAELERISQEEP